MSAGLQYALPATWTAMQKLDPGVKSTTALLQLSQWWSARPSQIAKLSSSKGRIEAGMHADFVVRSLLLVAFAVNVPVDFKSCVAFLIFIIVMSSDCQVVGQQGPQGRYTC